VYPCKAKHFTFSGGGWNVGFEAVDLAMEIEKEFGISLSDSEAFQAIILGQLHDYLLEHCAGRKRSDRPTRTAFYRLRRGLGAVLGVDVKTLRPSTPLAPLLKRRSVYRVWKRLHRELSLTLPPLEDRAGTGVFIGTVCCVAASFAIVTGLTRDVFMGFGVALVSMPFGALFGYSIGILCPRVVGKNYRTLGDLARGLVAFNYEHFVPSDDILPPNDDPVWDRLCDVLVRQLGARKDTLHRGTRFVADLGL
jgi:hypothetical protein